MTDIWDKKPKVNIGIDASDFTYKYYSGAEMDAWLEKLKEEVVTAWTKDENRLTKIIIERGRKLEAVEKWRTRRGLNLSDRQCKELSDILRGSTQTMNSLAIREKTNKKA